MSSFTCETCGRSEVTSYTIERRSYAERDVELVINREPFERINPNFHYTSFDYRNAINKVIFNNPATIVFWKDGTKTVVKCQPGCKYSKYVGFMACVTKKAFGNEGNFNNTVNYWLEHGEDHSNSASCMLNGETTNARKEKKIDVDLIPKSSSSVYITNDYSVVLHGRYTLGEFIQEMITRFDKTCGYFYVDNYLDGVKIRFEKGTIISDDFDKSLLNKHIANVPFTRGLGNSMYYDVELED